MSGIIAAVLALIEELLPASATGAVVEKIIEALTQIIPVLVKEEEDLAPIVQRIIGALRSNSVITPTQLDQLDEIEAQYDADFDKAADDAAAEDQ